MFKGFAAPRFKSSSGWAGVLGFAVLMGLGFIFNATSCAAGERGRQKPPQAPPAKEESPAYTNRLIDAASPYLLFHAHNPVDWYPWGPEALEKAKRENKPVFLSVGYSTCYWCHVAEKTIYSDPEIAKLMNEWFVNIKVDREERPDLDRVYMLATQLMTGHGGWPNNVFLTPDLKPIFAGSYFAPKDEPGRGSGFPSILKGIHEAWIQRRDQVLQVGERMHAAMRQAEAGVGGKAEGDLKPADLLAQARDTLGRQVDAHNGGFQGGGGTKFPMSPDLDLLSEDHRLNPKSPSLGILRKQLEAMAFGGIHDHLAGGFHRYSTEPTWSLPHFEKMLYDNAQLLSAYTQGFEATGDALYRRMAEETGDYLRLEMTAQEGGFYSAQDAEVGGREGASYLWSQAAIESALGKGEARSFLQAYELKPLPVAQAGPEAGREAEGGVIRIRLPIAETLKRTGHRTVPDMLEALAPARAKLLEVRNRRPQPLRDDKLLTGLNGLTIEAFVRSGKSLGRPQDLALARKAAEQIWNVAFDPKNGRLQHQIFRGRAQTDGFLDDYGLLGRGFMALYGTTGEVVWRQRAEVLAQTILQRFLRPDGSLKTSEREDLLIQPREFGDDTQPSGVSAAVDLLLRLGRETSNPRYSAAVQRALQSMGAQLREHPEAWPSLVVALNRHPLGTPTATTAKIDSLDTASHVRVTSSLRTRGDRAEAVITLRIDQGYHVNANPASLAYLIPTTLSLKGLPSVQVVYPKAVRIRPEFAKDGLEVYEGTLELVALLPEGWKGRRLQGSVTLQACTDQVCLPPAKIPFQVSGKGSRSQ